MTKFMKTAAIIVLIFAVATSMGTAFASTASQRIEMWVNFFNTYAVAGYSPKDAAKKADRAMEEFDKRFGEVVVKLP